MNESEKQQILANAKVFFKTRLATNHIKNTEKLAKEDAFNINPFTWRYLAKFAFGDTSPESLAKALIYPRALGTSLATSFGTNMQYFTVDVLKGFASTTQGIDIEFDDEIDGRHKYCQLKAGPTTINKDDIVTIENHFKGVKNLARTNGLRIGFDDCIVGVVYGEPSQLSANYKKIQDDYPVLVGKDFWHHLTGDENFYDELINAFASVADEMESSEVMNQTIRMLSYDIKMHEGNDD
jgi:hypothetical protein